MDGKKIKSVESQADDKRCPHFFAAHLLALYWIAGGLIALLNLPAARAADEKPEQVLRDLREFFRKCALPDGAYRPGVDAEYEGISDSAYSDLAPTCYAVIIHKTIGWKLPDEAKTRAFLLKRQRKDGSFFNVKGTVDPDAADGKAYNTTMALMALRGLGAKPKYDPLPVFDAVLVEDYKKLPAYMTSFFPMAYLCSGKSIPPEADKKIKALMLQDKDGWMHDHIAATFHAAHYYRLIGEPTPQADAMVAKTIRVQKPDGSWMLNLPARDRHAGFDGCFILKQLGKDRPEVKKSLARAADWVLKCRNADGGFGHYPGSTSDIDACFFQVGTLVMAGWLPVADPLPADPHLLGWGHLMPAPK